MKYWCRLSSQISLYSPVTCGFRKSMRLQCLPPARVPETGSRCQSIGAPTSTRRPRRSNSPWRMRSAAAMTCPSSCGQRLRSAATTSARSLNGAKKRGVVRARNRSSAVLVADAHSVDRSWANIPSSGTRIWLEIPTRSDQAATHCLARSRTSAKLRRLRFVHVGGKPEPRLIGGRACI